MAGLFRLLRSQFNPPRDPDPRSVSFAGKTVLLTGATSGLGYEAAAKFLALGVDTLILGCRDLDRGYATKTQLEKRTQRPDVVQVWELQMSQFQSVKQFADRVDREVGVLDVAVLNAGLWNRDFSLSDEGWEETMQVNTLSTTLLALLLLPKLRDSVGGGARSESGPAHLTVVSSQQFVRVKPGSLGPAGGSAGGHASGHGQQGSLLQHLNDPGHYAGPRQYGVSKLLLEYMLKRTADRVRHENGTVPVIINTVSPGLCASSLGRTYDTLAQRCVVWLLNRLFARTAEQGSRSLVSATYQGVESHGRCWRSDGYLDESNALTVRPEGRTFWDQAWREILDVLIAQAGEIEAIVDED